MLKLNASFSKKIPAEEQFSSQQYHCSIEVEIPDGVDQNELRRRIHDTFQMVRSTVEDELRNAPASAPASPQSLPQQNGNGNSNGFRRASNRQVRFLLDLGRKNGRQRIGG